MKHKYDKYDDLALLYAYVDIHEKLSYDGYFCDMQFNKNEIRLLKKGLERLFEDEQGT